MVGLVVQWDGALGDFAGQADLGAFATPGSCTYEAAQQVYRLASARTRGGNQTDHDAPDGGHFVWRRLAGDFIVTAQGALAGDGASAPGRLGWLVRGSLDRDAAYLAAVVDEAGRPALHLRRAHQATVEQSGIPRTGAPLTGVDVVQIERRGTTWVVSVARFGDSFTAVQVENLDLGDDVVVGLVCSAQAAGDRAEAVFRNVRIVVPAAPGFDRQRDPFGSRMEVLEVATGQRTVLFAADHVFEAPNWTRDGQALVYNSGGRLYRYDLAAQTASQIDTGAIVRNNNDHVISFDGTLLAISSHEGPDYASLIYTVPLAGGTPKLITPTGPSYLHGWSPDGKHLVYTALRHGDYDIYRIPVAGGEEEQMTTAPGLDDGPEYSPDGEFIYFNSVRSGIMQIWRMRPDGSSQEQLTDDEYNNWFPHISPDGQQVAFLSYLVGEVDPSDHPAARRVYLRLMPAAGGKPTVIAYLYGGQGTINVPSWSPDGTRLAFVSNTVP